MASGVSFTDLDSLVTTEYCQVAVLALMTYDWLVCLPSEVTHIWAPQRRKTMATMLYVVNRYVMTIALALPITTFFSSLFPTWKSCVIEATFATTLTLVPVLANPVLHALRVYTLSGRNKVLTAVTFVLSFADFVIHLIEQAAYARVKISPSPFGCSGYDTRPVDVAMSFVYMLGTLNLVANGLVIFVTWRNTRWTALQLEGGLSFGSSFSRVMLYHGSIYFVVIIIMTMMVTLFSILNLDSIFSTMGYPAIFLEPMQSVLISRFLLNLQETAADLSGTARSVDLNFASATGTSTSFPHFIASMGNSVHNDFGERTSSPDWEDETAVELLTFAREVSGVRTSSGVP